jgi:hypothetical protein
VIYQALLLLKCKRQKNHYLGGYFINTFLIFNLKSIKREN